MKKLMLISIALAGTINAHSQNFWEPTGVGPQQASGIAANAHGVFAGTSTFPGLVYYSSNEGTTWSLRFTSPPAINPTGIYSVGSANNGDILIGTGELLDNVGGTYRSTDNGISWTVLDGFGANKVVVNENQVIFAAMWYWLKRDWSTVLTAPAGWCGIRSVSVCQNGDILAGMVAPQSYPTCGIVRSSDGGSTWSGSSAGLTDGNVLSIAVDGSGSSGRAFAGTWSSGVFRSSDHGNSWQLTGLASGRVWDIVVNADGHIFAGTEGSGVFRSTDGGESWTQIISGLGNLTVRSLAISSNGRLFAGTQNGVYRSVQTTLDVEEVAGVPTSFTLMQNYPNPFNPSTTISYELPKQTHVSLKVFDALGREVATLVNGVEDPGLKSVHWGASGVASGVYFYRLQAGEFVQTRRLVLMK